MAIIQEYTLLSPKRKNGRRAAPRLVRVYSDYVEAEVSAGVFTQVDIEDAHLLEKAWHAGSGYASRADEHSGRAVYLHRQILKVDSQKVDHKDGNKLNNRRGNLRGTTHAGNMQNQKLRFDSTSGFKGVRKIYRKWSAQINHQGKSIYLGSADSPQEAARLYDNAAKRLFGEFAKTNEMMGLV